jgi:hypothetical protein
MLLSFFPAPQNSPLSDIFLINPRQKSNLSLRTLYRQNEKPQNYNRLCPSLAKDLDHRPDILELGEKARKSSFSKTIFAGDSFFTILQKIQSWFMKTILSPVAKIEN